MRIVPRERLPADPNILRNQMVMIQNAFGPNDVTYSQWEANGLIVQVAQMKTIVLIRARPLSPEPTPKLTKEARAALARDRITHLIRSQVDVVETTSRDRKKVVRTIMPDVLAASFEHANIRVCTDGLHGKCAPPELLEKRVHHYVWWWRCVNWWTDGNEVGIYFLKAQGGPWIPSYNAQLDATWFEASPFMKKTQQ